MREVRNLADILRLAHRDSEIFKGLPTGEHPIFRGVADASWALLPSLTRHGRGLSRKELRDVETNLLRDFVNEARAYLDSSITSEWERLTIAQHYGLPTRLLDWTLSPLVAAHFATLPTPGVPEGRPAALWMLNWYALQGAFAQYSFRFRISDLEKEQPPSDCDNFWDHIFASETPDPEVVVVIEPPAIDARVSAQGGIFTCCSDPTVSLDAFLEKSDCSSMLAKVVIPAWAKSRIREELDLCGITESKLVPGLDGVSRTVARLSTLEHRRQRRYRSAKGVQQSASGA